MALSIRGTAEGSAINGNDVTLTMPAGIAQDDVVYVAGGWGGTVDENPGVSTAGYTEFADLYQNDIYDTNFSINRKVQGATPDSSVVCFGPGVVAHSDWAAAYVAHVWTGADTTTPEDATTVTTTAPNTALWDSPSITTVTANAIVISCGLGTSTGAQGGDTTITGPTGYSNQVDINGGVEDTASCTVGMASKLVTSPGAEDPGAWSDITDSTSYSYGAATIAIRPAAAAGVVSRASPTIGRGLAWGW